MNGLIFMTMIGLLSFGIWLYWRRFQHDRRPKIIPPTVINPVKQHEQLSTIANLGNRIIHHVNPQSSINKSKLNNPELNELVIDTINIVVGKYKISDTTTLLFIENSVINTVNHLSASSSSDKIIREYSPMYSNDLILEISRDLFQYPTTDIMNKLLLAQYIANKTTDQEEIDYVYNYISSIAINPQVPSTVRMNAADMLNLSNNKRLMKTANQALELLRQETDEPANPFMSRPNYQDNLRPSNRTIAFEGTLQPTIAPIIIQPDGTTQIPHTPRTDLTFDPITQQMIWDQIQARNTAELPRGEPVTERTVYGDGQNVHNTEINNSVLESAHELVKKYTPRNKITFDYSLLSGMTPVTVTKIESSLHRILTDSTVFKHNTTLYSVFQAVLNFISQNPHKDELNKRLIEELTEMSSLCASGHLSRLINIFQGFSDDMKIKVNINDEIYSKINYILKAKIMSSENNEELLNDFNTPDKEVLISFCAKTIGAELPSIYKEYEGISARDDVLKSVKIALDKYTGTLYKFELLG